MTKQQKMQGSAEVQDAFIDAFIATGDVFNQFTYLLQLGSELDDLPDALKIGDALVEGCQSQVWLYLDHEAETLFIEADSDTLMMRGVLTILKDMFDGHSCSEILKTPVDLVSRTELGDVFDSKRITGIESIVARIKTYAQSIQ